jgi:hypothetical protein
MGIVGRWIDSVCETHPALMADVLSRPMSRLGEWIDWDADGGPCGCLIGTAALAAGIAESEGLRDPSSFLAPVLGQDMADLFDVGMRVHDISVRIAHGTLDVSPFGNGTHASDTRVIALIRTRIAVALAVGVGVGEGAPNELVSV